MAIKFPSWNGIVSMWWISWFAFEFFFIQTGYQELKREFSQGSPVIAYSLTLFAVTILSWVIFYVADHKVKTRAPEVIRAETITGSLLTLFTLMGIAFFAFVAPFVH